MPRQAGCAVDDGAAAGVLVPAEHELETDVRRLYDALTDGEPYPLPYNVTRTDPTSTTKAAPARRAAQQSSQRDQEPGAHGRRDGQAAGDGAATVVVRGRGDALVTATHIPHGARVVR